MGTGRPVRFGHADRRRAVHSLPNCECAGWGAGCRPWVCFELKGPFPLTQTGVLASFIQPLAAAGVAVFCIATFDTDYVLVGEEFAGAAMEALHAAGHEME